MDLLQAGGKPPGLFHSAKNRKESAKNMAFGSGTDIFGILGQVFGIADCAFIMEGCLCVFNAIFFLPLFLQSHGILLLGGVLPGGERLILSRLVDTFFSRVLYSMLLLPENHSIAVV